MHDSDRFRLLFGPYETPRFRYGDVVFDDVRGEVRIVDITNSRIAWPIGVRDGGRSLVVYGGLAEAVRREAGIAVCHWWGVTPQTVTKWRKALGVGPVTDGTHRLRSEYALTEEMDAAREKGNRRAREPEARAKLADAKRGKGPRPTFGRSWLKGARRPTPPRRGGSCRRRTGGTGSGPRSAGCGRRKRMK